MKVIDKKHYLEQQNHIVCWIVRPEELTYTVTYRNGEEITLYYELDLLKDLLVEYEDDIFDTDSDKVYYKMSDDLSVIKPFKMLNKERGT